MEQMLLQVMVSKGKIQAWNSPWEDQAGNPHCNGKIEIKIQAPTLSIWLAAFHAQEIGGCWEEHEK